jgi:hypothetical protein
MAASNVHFCLMFASIEEELQQHPHQQTYLQTTAGQQCT